MRPGLVRRSFYSDLSLAGGAMKRFDANLKASSMRMTGNEMATTATHSSQLRGVMTKRVCAKRESSARLRATRDSDNSPKRRGRIES